MHQIRHSRYGIFKRNTLTSSASFVMIDYIVQWFLRNKSPGQPWANLVLPTVKHILYQLWSTEKDGATTSNQKSALPLILCLRQLGTLYTHNWTEMKAEVGMCNITVNIRQNAWPVGCDVWITARVEQVWDHSRNKASSNLKWRPISSPPINHCTRIRNVTCMIKPRKKQATPMEHRWLARLKHTNSYRISRKHWQSLC